MEGQVGVEDPDAGQDDQEHEGRTEDAHHQPVDQAPGDQGGGDGRLTPDRAHQPFYAVRDRVGPVAFGLAGLVGCHPASLINPQAGQLTRSSATWT